VICNKTRPSHYINYNMHILLGLVVIQKKNMYQYGQTLYTVNTK